MSVYSITNSSWYPWAILFGGGLFAFLVAFWVSQKLKNQNTRAISFWVVLMVAGVFFGYIGVAGLVLGVISGCYILLKLLNWLYKLTKRHLDPVLDKRQKNVKEYRKYVLKCDQKGQQPLSYKKWKFAYGKKGL